jgi:hypothetical protein
VIHNKCGSMIVKNYLLFTRSPLWHQPYDSNASTLLQDTQENALQKQ